MSPEVSRLESVLSVAKDIVAERRAGIDALKRLQDEADRAETRTWRRARFQAAERPWGEKLIRIVSVQSLRRKAATGCFDAVKDRGADRGAARFREEAGTGRGCARGGLENDRRQSASCGASSESWV